MAQTGRVMFPHMPAGESISFLFTRKYNFVAMPWCDMKNKIKEKKSAEKEERRKPLNHKNMHMATQQQAMAVPWV